MGLIEEINNSFCQNELPNCPSFRAVLIGESAGYFEMVKSIVSFSNEEIVLALKNGALKIAGKGLYIKKYCLGDVVICGKIKSIEKI